MSDFEKIYEMHSYKRPHGSESERDFIARFLTPLGATRDPHGNYFVVVGKAKPEILYSCHTDTVHKSSGMQRLDYDGTWLKLHPKASSSCLGADCGAGVWLMTEMIKAKVPGLYVFHADEEHGQAGSRGFVETNRDYLASFKAAIAFDRRGKDSVITHMSVRTCSDAFAKSLVAQLPGYRLDDTGSVTDTKHYRGIVPECTNISVGYEGQHWSGEKLDVPHLIWLRDTLLTLDPSKFVIQRDPKAKDEYKTYGTTYYGGYDKSTIRGLVWAYSNDAAKVIESLMSYDEFKTLLDKVRADEQAAKDADWEARFGASWGKSGRNGHATAAGHASSDDDFDAWPGVTGRKVPRVTGTTPPAPPIPNRPVNSTATRALTLVKPGMAVAAGAGTRSEPTPDPTERAIRSAKVLLETE